VSDTPDFSGFHFAASTRRVQDTILTVEGLRSMAALINERDRKPAMSVEHDRLLPPMGQVIAGHVAPIEDGHHVCYVEYDVFPPAASVMLFDGQEIFQQQSESHQHPFATAEFPHADNLCIGIDPVALGGNIQTEAFFEELRKMAPLEARPAMRRSVLPDPEVLFTFGTNISAAWIGWRLSKMAIDAVEPEVKKLFEAIIATVKRTAVEAVPKNRPITYVLQVRGKPNLEFIARTRDAHRVITALTTSNLVELQPRIESLRKQFKAEMIQFVLQEDGRWAYNYLLTSDGKVIGVRRAFDERAVVLKKMEEHRSGPHKKK